MTEEQRALVAVIPPEWFKDPESSSVWMRVLCPVRASPEDIEAFFRGTKVDVSAGGELQIAFGRMEGPKLTKTSQLLLSKSDGGLLVWVHVDQLAPPDFSCWFFATPLSVDGRRRSEASAKRVLARASALLVLHAGLNLMYSVVYEGEVSASTGSWNEIGEVIRTPQAVDGPILSADALRPMSEVSDALRRAARETRDRILLSLEYIEAGVRGPDDFFSYWTALELIANGKAQTIRSRIQQIYGFGSVGEVDRLTGFATIARWRHDFYHKGLRPTLSADVARYIQFLFLDLLRHALKLPPLDYLRLVQSAPGYDLRPIGLADNRTDDQRRLVEESQRQFEPPKSVERTPEAS